MAPSLPPPANPLAPDRRLHGAAPYTGRHRSRTRALLLSLAWCGAGCVHAPGVDPAPSVGAKAPPFSPPTHVAVQVLTHETVLEANVEVERLADWIARVSQAFLDTIQRERIATDLIAQVVSVRGRPDAWSIAAVGGVEAVATKALFATAKAHPAPPPGVTSYALRFDFTREPASDEGSGNDWPSPEEEALAQLRREPLGTQRALIQQWVREEALPLLGHLASGVEERFEGVRAVGAIAKAFDPVRGFDVRRELDGSDDYWRGVVEMVPEDPLVPAIRSCLLVLEGRLDPAWRHVRLLLPVSARERAGTALLRQLSDRLTIFRENQARRLAEGIGLHDQGRYADAVARYESILAEYPHSSEALWELNLSAALATGLDSLGDNARATARRLYDADPLYPLALVSTGPEIRRTQRRLQLRALFREPERFRSDLQALAEIALDLEQYEIAAHAYWVLIGLGAGEQAPPRSPHFGAFLFSVDHLGVTILNEQFAPERRTMFEPVEAARRARLSAAPGGSDTQGGDTPEK